MNDICRRTGKHFIQNGVGLGNFSEIHQDTGALCFQPRFGLEPKRLPISFLKPMDAIKCPDRWTDRLNALGCSVEQISDYGLREFTLLARLA